MLYLSGPVVLGAQAVHREAWVVDGRLVFNRPSAAHQATEIPGWVLPGLVDVHCHIGLDAAGPVTAEVAEAQALQDRDSGVLLIRDAGSPSDTKWIDQRPDLPRVIRAGQHLARPKRYLRNYADELPAVSNLPEAMAQQARNGDGWVKLVADWIDRETGDLTPLWPDDVLAQGVAAAHAAGARVTAHAFSHEALPGLIAAGVDCIEHACGADRATAQQLARRGIPVTPTLLQIDQFLAIAAQADGKFPKFAARMRRLHAQRYETVAMLHEAGVQLLVGTDAGGTIAHGQIAAEIAEMVRAGIPAADVIADATWRGRQFLGAEPVGEDSPADLVVYADDPRVNVATLTAPRAVILRGEVVVADGVARAS